MPQNFVVEGEAVGTRLRDLQKYLQSVGYGGAAMNPFVVQSRDFKILVQSMQMASCMS